MDLLYDRQWEYIGEQGEEYTVVFKSLDLGSQIQVLQFTSYVTLVNLFNLSLPQPYHM